MSSGKVNEPIFGNFKNVNEDLAALTESSTVEDVELLYDKWAPQYDKSSEDIGFVSPNAYGEVFSSLPGISSKKDIKVIDLGAGTGLLGEQLYKHGYSNLDALDLSQGMLDEAKKKNVYKKLICAPLTERQTPGIEADEYDASVTNGALVFAHVKPEALDEMLRIIKPGGVITFTIRPDQMSHYEGKFKELEENKKWKLMSQPKTIPNFKSEYKPATVTFFAYTKC